MKTKTKTFKHYLELINESFTPNDFKLKTFKVDDENLQNEYDRLAELANSQYSILEKIFIHAWGQLLYLAIPEVQPNKKLINTSLFIKEYLDLSKNDPEELHDWISEGNGCRYKNGIQGFDESILLESFIDASNKTKTSIPISVTRSGEVENRWDFASYSLRGGYDKLEKTYILPIGTPIIWTTGLADSGEVLINKKYVKN